MAGVSFDVVWKDAKKSAIKERNTICFAPYLADSAESKLWRLYIQDILESGLIKRYVGYLGTTGLKLTYHKASAERDEHIAIPFEGQSNLAATIALNAARYVTENGFDSVVDYFNRWMPPHSTDMTPWNLFCLAHYATLKRKHHWHSIMDEYRLFWPLTNEEFKREILESKTEPNKLIWGGAGVVWRMRQGKDVSRNALEVLARKIEGGDIDEAWAYYKSLV